MLSFTHGKGKGHTITDLEGPEGSNLCLNSALDGVDQRQAPAALPPREIPGIHCIGGWVGLRVGLDGCGKSRSHRSSIPGPSSS